MPGTTGKRGEEVVETDPYAHPLALLLARHGGTNASYLRAVADTYRALGFGTLACRKEKVSRWLAGTIPAYETQVAMAALEGITSHDVVRHGWPGWLLLAQPEDRPVLHAPWTPESALTALNSGGPMDRRTFLITTPATIGDVLAHAAHAAPATSPPTGRHIGSEVPQRFERRLADLRLMDDQMGSAEVYTAAVAELGLITRTLAHSSYSEATARHLFSSAAEAARVAGWTAYDSGHHAAAERHYAAALRAATSAQDQAATANICAFWAIQHYSTGDPRGAVQLLEDALAHAPAIGSPRMTAMLHARLSRAHARAGDARASDRAAGAALDSYAHAGPLNDDIPAVYWFNLGEAHQLLGSSALNLGRARQALAHFQHATVATSPTGKSPTAERYDGEAFPRGNAIYLARHAEAHLALDDVDAALEAAHAAVTCMGGVTSARGSAGLTDLRAQLARRKNAAGVRDFLELTT
ncbi:transcriptional regulator [Streptomyces sp. NPDC007025]|uniref:transcriptional regulator n=1 Tax=Streptomyces sp. NPDC007025 TaxID=3364771 RepID=UPI003686E405